MKVEFEDFDHDSTIALVPETVREVAALLRMAKNAAAKKPEIYLSFRDNDVYCYVSIAKRKPSVQEKSIKP